MRIIALMNQKGGVGKTTTTVNLGAALAEQGKRVCLIDLDPQAHLTINYGVEPTADHISLYDVLIDDKSFLEAVHVVDKNVALVASSIDLAGAEIELVSRAGRETLLKKKLESASHDFDFILLDCPPSLGLLTINALAVAGEVIIPMQPHFLALQGVAKLLETVHLVSRRINPSLKVSGVVLTMYDAQTKLTGDVLAELNGFIEQAQGKTLPWSGAKVFATKIRRNIKLAECPSFGQTILKYDGASNGAFDYRNLARELIGLPPVAAPLARAGGGATKSPVASGAVKSAGPAPAMPPKPVMPPALVAAVKAQAQRKAATSASATAPPTAPAPAPAPATRQSAPGLAATTAPAQSPAPAPARTPAPASAPAPASRAPAVVAPASGTTAVVAPAPAPVISPARSAAPAPVAAPARVTASQRPLPAAVTAPIPPLNLTPPPLPPRVAPVASSTPVAPPAPASARAPASAPASAPAKPQVSVTINPAIDQSKLAAASASDAKKATADSDAAA